MKLQRKLKDASGVWTGLLSGAVAQERSPFESRCSLTNALRGCVHCRGVTWRCFLRGLRVVFDFMSSFVFCIFGYVVFDRGCMPLSGSAQLPHAACSRTGACV